MFDPASIIAGGLGLVGEIFGSNKEEQYNWEAARYQTGVDNRRMKQARRWSVKDAKGLRKQQRKDQMQYFQRTRTAAERAGVNPMAVMGMLPAISGSAPGATGVPQAGQPGQLSTNFAEAAMSFGNGLADAIGMSAQRNALEMENKKLNETIRDNLLRPNVPGMYGHISPTRAQAMGLQDGSDSARPSGGVSGGKLALPGDLPLGYEPLITTDPADPRREVVNNPITTDVGYVWIDGPAGRFRVPAINGEVLDASQAAVVGGAYVYDKFGGKWAESKAKGNAKTKARWMDIKMSDQEPQRYAYKRYKDRVRATPMGYKLPFEDWYQ